MYKKIPRDNFGRFTTHKCSNPSQVPALILGTIVGALVKTVITKFIGDDKNE